MVDTIFALFVAAVGILSCVSLSAASNMAQQSATENNLAYNAARQVVENMHSYKGAVLANGSYAQSDVLALGAVPQLSNLTNPSISMTVADWRSPVKYIKVTVTWTSNSANSLQRSQTFVSLAAPKGLAQ